MKSPAEVLRRIVDQARAEFDTHELTTVQVSLDQADVAAIEDTLKSVEETT